MQKNTHAFTLVEILISMSVLIVGLVGILSLFPVGLNATKKAIEDTNAAMIAESVFASLRAAAQETTPNGKIRFFYDGIDNTLNSYPSGVNFKESDLRTKSFGIPAPTAPVAIASYPTGDALLGSFCRLASGDPSGNLPYNTRITQSETDNRTGLRQYSFNIQISYPTENPKSLYDVVIRINRSDRLIKKFYTQIMIPTAD